MMAVARQEMSEAHPWPDAITTLYKEHRHMSLLLDTLDERLQGENKIATSDFFLIHDIVHYMHEYPDAVHHPTEDLMFARLILRDPSTKADVQYLQHDHEKLTGNTDRILKLLRDAEARQTVAAADEVRAACRLYIDRLRAHIQKEESGLFPSAVESLTIKDWKSIDARLNAVDDPLFGRTVDSRFRVLFEYFSGRAGDVSRQITLFSFLQFDSYIESADSLEQGAGEMIAMIREQAESVIDESKVTWQKIIDSHDVSSLIGNQYGFAAFIGRKTLTVGSAATSIYWKTVKQMLVPFLPRK
jgi:hemerythrin-like domain-containing protein